MWRSIRRATDGKRTPRNTSMAQLFGDERCTAAILEFLATTEVGLRGRLRADEPGGGERGCSDTESEDGLGGEAQRRAGTMTGEEWPGGRSRSEGAA
jgi:hypothetical protein